jgi:hypothetical protein
MLNIFICIIYTISCLLSAWLVGRTFKNFDTFHLGITPLIFRKINRIFKTSFVPNKDSFIWAVISAIIHSPPLFLNKAISIFLIDKIILTKIELAFVIISAIIIITTFLWLRKKIDDIFNELDAAVLDGDAPRIINWIKKYPYFFKIAKIKYEGNHNIFAEVHQGLKLHEDLQLELSGNNLPAKRNKNKL